MIQDDREYHPDAAARLERNTIADVNIPRRVCIHDGSDRRAAVDFNVRATGRNQVDGERLVARGDRIIENRDGNEGSLQAGRDHDCRGRRNGVIQACVRGDIRDTKRKRYGGKLGCGKKNRKYGTAPPGASSTIVLPMDIEGRFEVVSRFKGVTPVIWLLMSVDGKFVGVVGLR